jgi:predicted ATP-grasp superfamily ATP-dependent carboligase
MRILAYEFITGGGCARFSIASELAREGEAMLAGLLSELSYLEGIDVQTTRDSRLAPAPWGAETVVARPGEDPTAHFTRALCAADAVWPIAPETDGVLLELTSLIVSHERILLGSRPDAVLVSASKWRTARHLRKAGIAVVPTYREASQIPDEPGDWVVKPDDGAGCADTFRLPSSRAARTWLMADAAQRFVAQPWIDGDALSLSLLCREGSASILACNRQHVGERCALLTLDGITVDAMPVDAALEELAQGVASALPGLWGYVGVDLVYADRGPVVIEINPRLTTSYCGLGARLDINVAAAVLGLAGESERCAGSADGENPTLPFPRSTRKLQHAA